MGSIRTGKPSAFSATAAAYRWLRCIWRSSARRRTFSSTPVGLNTLFGTSVDPSWRLGKSSSSRLALRTSTAT
jgi:hypothetical protein